MTLNSDPYFITMVVLTQAAPVHVIFFQGLTKNEMFPARSHLLPITQDRIITWT